MKYIKIKVINTPFGKIGRIIKQTHRGNDFGRGGSNEFMAKNGFLLNSTNFPQTNSEAHAGSLFFHLCVCGLYFELDHTPFIIPSEEWLQRLKEAVKEYNETFADKPDITEEAEVIE